ncbi:TPA: hypothetical protein RUW99_001078 [Aeromonas veronii]|nr:hypothetical protein [Aeromonas veronii]
MRLSTSRSSPTINITSSSTLTPEQLGQGSTASNLKPGLVNYAVRKKLSEEVKRGLGRNKSGITNGITPAKAAGKIQRITLIKNELLIQHDLQIQNIE